MDPATATTVLLVLGSAFGVMFATMTTLLVVSIRVQHRESKETREYVTVQIEKAFGDVMGTLGDAVGALRLEFNERLGSRFNELMRVIEHNEKAFGDAVGTLGDTVGALRLEFNERLDSRFNELMRVIEHNEGTLGDTVGALRLEFNERLDSRFKELMRVIEHNEGTLGDAVGTLGDTVGALRLEFNERLDSRFKELMRVIEHNHQISELQHKATQKRLDRLEAGFADLSERLARIEGHLGIVPHQQPADTSETNSDAA